MNYILFCIINLVLVTSSFGYTILVDPGHGGEDKGATYQMVKKNKTGQKIITPVFEKDLDLQIAKRIYKKLERRRYKVFLTRSIDRTVRLEERANMAEKLGADLFISVHVNSSFSRRSKGFETYYLDNHRDVVVKKVEAAENRNLKGEALIVQQIITDLIIEKTVVSSSGLARNIHASLVKTLVKKFKVVDRGVKPGLFYVLALAKRPAVLLEVGFISNPDELKKMMSRKFQEAYATAVVDGIDKFVKKQLGKLPPSLL